MESWKLPRYKGSRLIGSKINEYTVGDTTYGLNPVAEQNSSVLYFGKTIIGADGEDDNLVTIELPIVPLPPVIKATFLIKGIPPIILLLHTQHHL